MLRNPSIAPLMLCVRESCWCCVKGSEYGTVKS